MRLNNVGRVEVSTGEGPGLWVLWRLVREFVSWFKLFLQSFFLAVVLLSFLLQPERGCRFVCFGSYSKLDT